MAIATIQIPGGGTAEIEVPEGATEAQILAFVESQDWSKHQALEPSIDPNIMQQSNANNPARPMSMGEKVQGTLGMGGQMLTGMAGEVAGGVSGLATTALTGDPKAGAAVVEGVRDTLSLTPGKETQRVMGAVNEYAQHIPEVGAYLGEKVADAGGSPGLSTAAHVAPTALAELFGLGALRKLRTGTRLLDDAGMPTATLRRELDRVGLDYEGLTPESRALIPATADQSLVTRAPLLDDATTNVVVEQLSSGGRDGALAGLRLTNGNVKASRIGREGLKQGFAPGFIQAIKTATPETRNRMAKMVRISRKIKGNERASMDVRPSDVVGESVVDRLYYIRREADKARNELSGIVKNKLQGKQINLDPIESRLRESLDKIKVRMKDNGGAPPSPVFEGSLISKNPAAKKAINDLFELLQEGGYPDALRAHDVKKQLDEIIDFNKASASGLTDAGRNVLKDVRSAMNDAVRTVDPDYARVNDVLSKSLTALDDFNKASGASIDIFGTGNKKAIGTKMRGLMSNIQSRVNLENSINGLDGVAKDLGANFTDDVKDLQMFANALDARFGAVAKSSFQGNIEQAINRVLTQGMAQEAVNQTAGAVSGFVRKKRGINEFGAYEALDGLLKGDN